MYLKTNVIAEPLVSRWPAWSYLIPPVTAGCNILNRYIKIMESFIQFPKIHVEASTNPELIGGPFLHMGVNDVDAVQDLLNTTILQCRDYIALAKDIKLLQSILKEEAKGSSIEPLYNRVPDHLKGFVELVYDINNQPRIILIERLLYNEYYSENLQSVFLSLRNQEERPFGLSTPNITDCGGVEIKLPFADSAWDKLFKSRHESCDFKKLFSELQIDRKYLKYFSSFFSSNRPATRKERSYLGNNVRLRYFGHATILLQTKSLSFLVDPLLSYDVGSDDRFTYSDLPDVIDFVLITHNHQDHISLETLLQIRYKIKTIVVPRNKKGALEDPSLKMILEQLGFKNIICMDEFETIDDTSFRITSVPFLGEHGDLDIQSKTSYFFDINTKKILFAADSNNLESSIYKHVFKHLGQLDILFLGMECEGAPLSWLYGPLMNAQISRSDDSARRLCGSNYLKAWELAKISGCKAAYVYAMGLEPWLPHIMGLLNNEHLPQLLESDKFVNKCRENNIFSERLYLKKEWFI